MPLTEKIGFIGAGAMAEALAKGFVNGGVIQASQVLCTDPSTVRKDVFRDFGATAFDDASELCKTADVIFIATKPQYVGVVLKENAATLASKLVVSIAAGVTCDQMIEALGSSKCRVIRVMPNTPCLVGETASAMCLAGAATQADGDIVKTLFDAVGVMKQVGENLFSAVTGLSGSGPAYVYLIIEGLADGAVRAGLPRDIALELAAQTVLGGAKMVLETGKHPGALKDMVTSPGGTTIAGVHALEQGNLRATMMNAVLAAADRATELSKL